LQTALVIFAALGRFLVDSAVPDVSIVTFLPYGLARLSGEPGLFLLTLVAADGEGAYVQYWAHLARLSVPIGTVTFSSGARTRPRR
jgi:hypothetical protein